MIIMEVVSHRLFPFLCCLLIFTIISGTSPQQPSLLYHFCMNDEGNYTVDSTYRTNLNILLTNLTSNTEINYGFYNSSYGENTDKVNAIGLCRGDVKPDECRYCLIFSSALMTQRCPNQKEAIGWFDNCMLRYSNRSIFGVMESSPVFYMWNPSNATDGDKLNQGLTNLMTSLRNKASSGDSRRKYAAANVTGASQYIYGLVQCTPDLSGQQCDDCLVQAVSQIPDCCNNKRGGRVVSPSCNIRYEIYRFFTPIESPLSTNNTSSEGKSNTSRMVIAIAVPSAFVLLLLCCVGCCIFRRRKVKNYKTILKENFGSESNALESLQFDMETIETATNKFAPENKIGKGGFGEVYKGILPDQREVAVKRLSKNFGQGVEQFKNEVLLIAKLQHRNLVALFGFCLEEQEKILVYEYVPNHSLDYFLFGSKKQRLLAWIERHQIIGGIARGILYLHEYSRLKVIHRDLKPSNILLDDNMNPKISDFGLARMVNIDETQGSTNKIVGTYGYMSPEYAMFGEFSEKSDVFSFGVMTLEIISGKRNGNSFVSQHSNRLLSYAWQQWRNEKPLELIDPKLEEDYPQIEVMKCIQIGLLCVQENPDARPPMATVVSYLSNYSIQLPFPKEPAFFMHNGMEPNPTIGVTESNSGHSIPSSVYEMSMSTFFPR